MSSAKQIGDYRLKDCLSEDAHKATWTAEQVSVGRVVVLDVLLDLSSEGRECFFSDTRARAAVDHPFIASVYEAVDAEGHCFRASERLTGETLQSMLDAGRKLEPAELTRMLRCMAEANLHHQTNERATLPLNLGHIHIDGGGVTRLANLALAGDRAKGDSARDVEQLGAQLVPLVADGCPGSTRMLTLLAWMRGDGRPAPLQWQEIISLCDQIERQLSAPTQPFSPQTSASNTKPRERRKLWMLAGMATMALLAIAIIAWVIRPVKSEPHPDIRLAPVLIPAGEYPTLDGGTMKHSAFLIDARETTIAEYRDFLETLAVLKTEDRHRTFDHSEQPLSKLNHEPDDWPALLAAARARREWNGKPVSLDSPVPGVDWWDAMAYANWRRARLPTEEEWAAALHHENDAPAEIPAAPWLPHALADCPDRTPTGIHHVAGSLSEWTCSLSVNPANPLGRPQHVIVGGSHLKPEGGALSREWTGDPGLRRIDLGFRLVRDLTDSE